MVVLNFLLFFTVFSLSVSSQYSVLFSGMHMSDSHIGSIQPAAKRIHEVGFNIHYLETHIKPEKFKFSFPLNHTYIRLPDAKDFDEMIYIEMWTKMVGAAFFPFVWMSGENALVTIMTHHRDELAPVLRSKYDLVICDELFSMISYGLALRKQHEDGTPFIVYSTTVSTAYFRYHQGLGVDPFRKTPMFLPTWRHHDVNKFEDRLLAFCHEFTMAIGVHGVTGYLLRRGLILLESTEFSFPRLTQQASAFFTDELDFLVAPTPTANNVINVGLHCEKHMNQNPDPRYATLLNDTTTKGTIYIAFGTQVPWIYAPKETTDAYVEALNQLTDYRIIFSFTGDPERQLPGLKPHVKIVRFSPQHYILNHPRTVLFISHGGLKSLKESICSDTPILVMPLFAEQSHNAELAHQMGIGDIVDKTNISGENLYRKIRRILDDNRYKNGVQRVHKLMLDRPLAGPDLAAHYARRVAKVGLKMLEYKQKFPTFVTFCSLDQLLILLTAVVIVAKV